MQSRGKTDAGLAGINVHKRLSELRLIEDVRFTARLRLRLRPCGHCELGRGLELNAPLKLVLDRSPLVRAVLLRVANSVCGASLHFEPALAK